MSTGSKPTLLLKAAPQVDQLAERLADGPWDGVEIALGPHDLGDRHLAGEEAVAAAAAVTRAALGGLAVTAEAPLSWPGGAFVSVDRLDDEARAGIEASAGFAAAVGSPVLTIHLFVPIEAGAFRAAPQLELAAVER